MLSVAKFYLLDLRCKRVLDYLHQQQHFFNNDVINTVICNSINKEANCLLFNVKYPYLKGTTATYKRY